MTALPSGTVTFVFSDIEGSTRLLKALGDAYGDVLSAHRTLMRETFTARDGVEIDTQGDAFFFAFSRARDAVAAAVEAQRAHATHAWPTGNEVRVRMGLHTGEPAVGGEGYLGIDVVRAARLCTVAQGGQVLLSETTRALVGASVPDGVCVHALGERRLKDIDEPERVFELDIDGVPSAAPSEPARVGVSGDGAVPTPPRAEEPQPPRPHTPADKRGGKRKKGASEDFGARLSQRIQERVRRTIEERVEAHLDRVFSEVEALADRAARRPETIAERLDDSEP
jgi:class 3 adenylate cyclase